MSTSTQMGVFSSDTHNTQQGINQRLLFVLILLLGVGARRLQFNQVPPGLNQDEASIGVEAY